MKKINFPLLAVLSVIVFSASSCQVVEGIFKAGFWSAIILIVIIVAVIMWIIGKSRK